MTPGVYYEKLAAQHLQSRGLLVLERNYRCKAGEIDLICSQDEQLVFVEVRARHNSRYASAAASVTRDKQHKIIRTAQHYLQRRNASDRCPCRFDIIAFSPSQGSDKDRIQWLKKRPLQCSAWITGSNGQLPQD